MQHPPSTHERYGGSSIVSADISTAGRESVLRKQPIYYLLPFVLLAIVFSDTFVKLVRGWFTYDGSHGLLIFAFGVYIFWVKRHEVANLSAVPAPWSGTVLTVLGGLGYLAGRFTGTWSLEGISLIVTVLGLALLLGGKRVLVFSSLPVGYMIFMFPFFDELLGGISIHLQLITAWLASGMLKLVGMPAFLTEQYITLPHVNLEVAKACNGINHITALLAITIPFSFFVHRSWYKRAALIVSAVAIGILLNGVRVASIGIITSLQRGGPLHGPSDVFYVSFIFFTGLLIQLFISHLLGRDRVLSEERAIMSGAHDGDRFGRASSRKEITALALATSTIAFVGLGLVFREPQPAALAAPLDAIPATVGTFEGRNETNKFGPFKGINMNVELFRRYDDPASRVPVYLYVGYMPIQNYETKITNYPSEILLTRSGILAVKGKDGPVKVRRASWNEAGVRRTAYYWYVIDNQILTERFQAKRETLRQAFEKGRTAAAIVIVVSETTLPSDEAERNTLAYVEEAIPIVNEHLY